MKAQTEKTAAAFTSSELTERTLHRRAVEAIIWGIPIVNYDLMFQAFVGIGGKLNQIVYCRKGWWRGEPLNGANKYVLDFGKDKTARKNGCLKRLGTARRREG